MFDRLKPTAAYDIFNESEHVQFQLSLKILLKKNQIYLTEKINVKTDK